MTIAAAEKSCLIGAAYEAALDPALWTSFLRSMNQSVGASASCIFLHDFADASAPTDLPDASLGVLEGFDPKAWDDYTQYFAPLNVWTRMEESLPAGIAVTSSMLFSDEQLPNTEFGADWLRPQNLFYALGGVVDRLGTVALKMSFVRAKRGGTFGQEALALWQSMMPHIQRAADLHRRLAGADQRCSDAEAALALLPIGGRPVEPQPTGTLRERLGQFASGPGPGPGDRPGRLSRRCLERVESHAAAGNSGSNEPTDPVRHAGSDRSHDSSAWGRRNVAPDGRAAAGQERAFRHRCGCCGVLEGSDCTGYRSDCCIDCRVSNDARRSAADIGARCGFKPCPVRRAGASQPEYRSIAASCRIEQSGCQEAGRSRAHRAHRAGGGSCTLSSSGGRRLRVNGSSIPNWVPRSCPWRAVRKWPRV